MTSGRDFFLTDGMKEMNSVRQHGTLACAHVLKPTVPQVQQRGSESPRRRATQESSPPHPPRLPGPFAQDGWLTSHFRSDDKWNRIVRLFHIMDESLFTCNHLRSFPLHVDKSMSKRQIQMKRGSNARSCTIATKLQQRYRQQRIRPVEMRMRVLVLTVWETRSPDIT